MCMAKLLVLHGPNLQYLGMREPYIYGKNSLSEVQAQLSDMASSTDTLVSFHQSDSEAEILEHLHSFHENHFDALIFNPAAFTHSSIVIRDALLTHQIPFIEVHLSNPHQRECFRRVSLFSDIAQGIITGCGALGYKLAFEAACHRLGIKHG